MEAASGGSQDVGVELANGTKFNELGCPDDLTYLLESRKYAQCVLDRLARALAPFDMRFASSKRKCCYRTERRWSLV